MDKSGIKGGNKARRESGMETKVRQTKRDGGKINKQKKSDGRKWKRKSDRKSGMAG